MVPNFVDYRGSEHFWDKGNTGVQKRRTQEEIDLHLSVSYTNNQQGENYG